MEITPQWDFLQDLQKVKIPIISYLLPNNQLEFSLQKSFPRRSKSKCNELKSSVGKQDKSIYRGPQQTLNLSEIQFAFYKSQCKF